MFDDRNQKILGEIQNINKNEYVFHQGPISRDTVYRAIALIREDGINFERFYLSVDSGHTFATRAIESGMHTDAETILGT